MSSLSTENNNCAFVLTGCIRKPFGRAHLHEKPRQLGNTDIRFREIHADIRWETYYFHWFSV